MKNEDKRKIFEELLAKESININKKYDENKKTRYIKKVKDLHGYNRYDAERVIKALISSYKNSQVKELKIICGKGKHSIDEPIIFNTVNNLLEQLKGYYDKKKTDNDNNIYIYWS